MRFISRYGKNGVAIRGEVVEAYANGSRKVTQTQIAAYFQPYMVTPEERQLAIQSWHFNGFYQEQDEVTPVPPDYRIGLFDSVLAQAENGWSDEERQLVEAKLIKLADATPTDLLAIVVPTLAPPWPRYDAFDGTTLDLMNKIVEDGYTLEAVLAYERENQNRDEVVEALEQMIDDGDVVPTIVAEEELVG